MRTEEQIQTMIKSYITCALWSCYDPKTEDNLDTLGYTEDSLSPEAMKEAVHDCNSFVEQAGNMLGEQTPEQDGHDFWLTRCGHGAGFWDRGLVHGVALSALCDKMGSRDLVIGDDNQLYFEIC